ncbi:hypothetical protein [Jiangella alkaliphila]|uniref:Uncharacterized protein n=1 Tax=Jiangella alkaliphila TaxID=419479 RepID=A0A1H2H0Y4_9ACTN|nr:hypothetical protein [Jiangella alkaliphila]SDU25471.1 hypothetical protein SAMN04488563_0780 [Jiangella alkaliphila]
MFFFFPDNTVLNNFAAVDKLDLLEELLRGRGRWVDAIAYEASRSAAFHPKLASIADDGWLGDPIVITDEGEQYIVERTRRSAFGGDEREPLKHLGEAQTCHVLQHWEEFNGSYWITDDGAAAEYARDRSITTRETMDLISEAIADGAVTREEGFRILQAMRLAGRNLRIPKRASEL